MGLLSKNTLIKELVLISYDEKRASQMRAYGKIS